MSRKSSLWIDRENDRDRDSGPFSSARWHRQSLEWELAHPKSEPPPEPPPPAARRRLLPLV